MGQERPSWPAGAATPRALPPLGQSCALLNRSLQTVDMATAPEGHDSPPHCQQGGWGTLWPSPGEQVFAG